MQMIRCYTTISTRTVREQLFFYVQTAGGWISDVELTGYNIYLPEDRVAWALLIDPELIARPLLDYIL